jgi:hypothetical protein
MVEAQKPHENVTREDLKLLVAQQQRPHGTPAQQALFEKTLSLYRVYRVHGCLGPLDPLAISTANDEGDEWATQKEKARRGHNPKLTCNGQLVFDYDHTGKAFVR